MSRSHETVDSTTTVGRLNSAAFISFSLAVPLGVIPREDQSEVPYELTTRVLSIEGSSDEQNQAAVDHPGSLTACRGCDLAGQ